MTIFLKVIMLAYGTLRLLLLTQMLCCNRCVILKILVYGVCDVDVRIKNCLFSLTVQQ